MKRRAPLKLAIVGAGWAGLAAAVEATRHSHAVTLFEAARTPGGRARRIHDGDTLAQGLDNGQHILIGAYSATLALMRQVGIDPACALLRRPLSLRFADRGGLALPSWPSPFDLLAGILAARGWHWREKAALLRVALGWRHRGFRCEAGTTVAELCEDLSPRVVRELIEPLCVSALNTPVSQACAQVFLRVLHDALFAERGGADLLLPRVDLSALLPDATLRWLASHGATLRLGTRVQDIESSPSGWRVDGQAYDCVMLASAPWDAARLVRGSGVPADAWLTATEALRFEPIATVYLQSAARLAAPMIALHTHASAPAQFVFDRGQLGGPAGLLAFVVSANRTPRNALQAQVIDQAAAQLGLDAHMLKPLQTVVEKRATFACTPGLVRPPMRIAPGLLACGDYVAGPYPATLEGAVRSGTAGVGAFQAEE